MLKQWSGWLVVGALMAGGCGHAPLALEGPILPFPEVEGRYRSIVFQSPKLRQLHVDQAPGDEPMPWYAWRNDNRLTTHAGFRTVTVDRLVNVTIDRQRISGGRTRDHYQNTTYRHSVTQTVR